jgi:hypothetical protein
MKFIMELKKKITEFRPLWLPPKLTDSEKNNLVLRGLAEKEVEELNNSLQVVQSLLSGEFFSDAAIAVAMGCMRVINLNRIKNGSAALDIWNRSEWKMQNTPENCINLFSVTEEIKSFDAALLNQKKTAEDIVQKYENAISDYKQSTDKKIKTELRTRRDDFYLTMKIIGYTFLFMLFVLFGIFIDNRIKHPVADLNTFHQVFYASKKGDNFTESHTVRGPVVLPRTWEEREVKFPKAVNISALRIDPFENSISLRTQIRTIEFIGKDGSVISKIDFIIPSGGLKEFLVKAGANQFYPDEIKIGEPPVLVSKGSDPSITLKDLEVKGAVAVRYEIRVTESWKKFK